MVAMANAARQTQSTDVEGKCNGQKQFRMQGFRV